MKAFAQVGFFLVAVGIVATPLRADPPQLTAGPVVEFIIGPQTSDLLASERGLEIAADDLGDLVPAYNDGTGSQLIVLNDGTAGTVTSPINPTRYGADEGS